MRYQDGVYGTKMGCAVPEMGLRYQDGVCVTEYRDVVCGTKMGAQYDP